MPLFALLLALAQQPPDTFVTDSLARPIVANRVNYTITATLDEEQQKLKARGIVVVDNQRGDTLRDIYLHQYLNAFRPGSKWSEVDEREGRVRFQHLRDPDYAYERFTAPPRQNNDLMRVEYPFAPDSTVVRLVLPRPVAPGEEAQLFLEWEARPSTTLRRQGRRGRSWDFAQWYPKVAVRDNGGWQAKPLLPAGEFYGEFGHYEVSLILREDQVVGATGLLVHGDPGWERAARFGRPQRTWRETLNPNTSIPAMSEVPAGHKLVHFSAANVHHFAFSVSPDYQYEGGVYVRRQRADSLRTGWDIYDRLATWDTLALHVLYRPGDEREWGQGQALARTRVALEWLEKVYGPYHWPQLTNLHRLEGGGTEFPMLMMNGSGSQGLILHEGGHMYTQGMLANNEYRSGWMDEGLSSYQTRWAQGATPQDRASRGGRDSIPRVGGYRGRLPRRSGTDARQITQIEMDLRGIAQPIGTLPEHSREFAVYNAMTYDRAELMFGALRDAMGDSAFATFLRNYYRDWAFLHVDERAMRTTAERAHGSSLQWFFDQWIRSTGLTDYALLRVRTERAPDGQWVTRGLVRKRGEYAHPMPLGVLTSSGWTVARGSPSAGEQWIEVRTSEKPRAVRLDPLRTTEDWDRRNDVAPPTFADIFRNRPREENVTTTVLDLPFLDQSSRDRQVDAIAPLLWYGSAEGAVAALRSRSSYIGSVDRVEVGFARGLRRPGRGVEPMKPFQYWLRVENPRLWRARPLMGAHFSTFALDGVAGVELGRDWDASEHHYAQTRRTTRHAALSVTSPTDNGYLPARWDDAAVAELRVGQRMRFLRGPWRRTLSLDVAGGAVDADWLMEEAWKGYARGELSVDALRYAHGDRLATFVRLFAGGGTSETPRQRGVYLSARDPYRTFWNHWVRPGGGVLDPAHHYVPLGGAGLRGYSPLVRAKFVVAASAEQGVQLGVLRRTPRPLALWATAFADAGVDLGRSPPENRALLADAGIGLSLRGWLYDREIRLRLDAPLWVESPQSALHYTGTGRIAPRIQFSFSDLW